MKEGTGDARDEHPGGSIWSGQGEETADSGIWQGGSGLARMPGPTPHAHPSRHGECQVLCPVCPGGAGLGQAPRVTFSTSYVLHTVHTCKPACTRVSVCGLQAEIRCPASVTLCPAELLHFKQVLRGGRRRERLCFLLCDSSWVCWEGPAMNQCAGAHPPGMEQRLGSIRGGHGPECHSAVHQLELRTAPVRLGPAFQTTEWELRVCLGASW